MNRLNQENKEKVFLATTALEEFWDTAKPIVFLGEWCLLHSRRSAWEPLNGKILQVISKDKKGFIEAYVYLQDVYERLLKQMAALLDEIHGEKHDIRYWRVIIGPWLFHYIDILYDRYTSIQTAKSQYPSFDTAILSEESFVTPRNTLEFLSLSSQEDLYNLQIYSKILSAENNKFRQKSFDVVKKNNQSIHKKKFLGDVKKKFIKACLYRIALADKGKSVYLVDPFFSKRSIIKIFLKSKGKVKPIYPAKEELPVATPNKNMRNCLKKMSLKNNGFEHLIEQLLPQDIPYSFMESYQIIKQESLMYPSKPKAIMSWVSWYFDEKFKFWAAAAVESGCSLYGVQHGGNYGLDQYMKSVDHEIAITDKYYSWGWTYPEFPERTVPMPASKIIGGEKNKKEKKSSEILFAGNIMTRYLFRMEYPNAYQSEKYLANQIKFFKSVGLGYRKIIRYRALIKDGWFDIVNQIQDAFPDLLIDDLDIPFQESLMNCQLFVCDHLGTVYAEALSLNRPTILFWDPELYIHRPEARRCLANLHDAGILHYSSESAANKVCEVYDNADEWWNERERQSALADFCDHYAQNSPAAINEWVKELKKIAD